MALRRLVNALQSAGAVVDASVAVRPFQARGLGLVGGPANPRQPLLHLPTAAQLLASEVSPPGVAHHMAGISVRLAAVRAESSGTDLLSIYSASLGEDPPRNGPVLLPKHFSTAQFKDLCLNWRGCSS
eukprot:TRINITY_DN11353_c0_g1_i4.p1 TRINITY_DN11353_c0_g1~~TRINITY_DN11353_c0_g1_i4.p1  ORF type:complete len:128 (+),score=9.84 TRINITY_DN11353_c0_g1_i4:69-452(+)